MKDRSQSYPTAQLKPDRWHSARVGRSESSWFCLPDRRKTTSESAQGVCEILMKLQNRMWIFSIFPLK